MNDWLNKDKISSLVMRAIDLLFVKNPQGTSMGVCFGVILQGLVNILDPWLKGQQMVDFSRGGFIFYILLGVFLFNIPSLLRRPRLDPKIEVALASIAKARREGKISSAHAKLLYRSLCEQIVRQVVLKEEILERINKVQELAQKEIEKIQQNKNEF